VDQAAREITVDGRAVERCARGFKLALPRTPLGGPAGRVAGADVGSSLDFQDFRAYFPGDDVRHVDWSVYARSDQLVVKLFREEVAPDVEVVLDCSRSMGLTDGKAGFVLSLARLFLMLGVRARGRSTLCLAGDRAERVASQEAPLRLGAEVLDGSQDLGEVLAGSMFRFRRRSVRVIVSDFLFPHEPLSLVSRIARGAAAVFIVQALDPGELDPSFVGGHLLVDVESNRGANVLVDASTVARYRERLDALTAGLARASQLWATPFARVAAQGLEEACRGDLLRAGILEVA
jgi:uncharacterized protein (DUF58 family)